MTVVSNVQALPRVIVRGYIQAARLPLNAAARATKQQGNAQWRPAVAFDAFQANVETWLGSVLHDGHLIDDGRVRQLKVSKLREAAELKTLAEQERLAADEQAQQRRDQIEEQREETERRAAQRKSEIERQKQLHDQKARDRAAKKTAAAKKLKESADKNIDRRERAATESALTAEAQALDVSKQALQADAAADAVADELEHVRAARKSS